MEIEKKLREFLIRETFGGEAPTDFGPEFDLIESGRVDSLSTMNLVTHIEETYGIEFGINDIVPRNFRTLGTLTTFITGRMTAAGGSTLVNPRQAPASSADLGTVT